MIFYMLGPFQGAVFKIKKKTLFVSLKESHTWEGKTSEQMRNTRWRHSDCLLNGYARNDGSSQFL